MRPIKRGEPSISWGFGLGSLQLCTSLHVFVTSEASRKRHTTTQTAPWLGLQPAEASKRTSSMHQAKRPQPRS